MNSNFEDKVWAAAIAGWWTLLIGTAFLILHWGAFLLLTSARPAWLLSLWGNRLSWDSVRTVWFWGMALFKFCLWLLALVVVWLTIWAGKIRKNSVS